LTERAVLEIDNVTKRFGGLTALHEVSLSVSKGSITALIGPNGAGKSTLFSVITGFVRPDAGQVSYLGEDLRGCSPGAVAMRGIGRFFQEPRVFRQMTVLSNVAVAAKRQPGENPIAAFLTPRRVRRSERANVNAAREHLAFVGLSDKAHLLAEQLSYGHQKLLAIARLLGSGSDLLLLDEPTAGVHPDMVDAILDVLRRLVGIGKTVLVIEHNLNVVLRVSDWVYLLDQGKVAAFGSASEVLNDPALQEAYLGV